MDLCTSAFFSAFKQPYFPSHLEWNQSRADRLQLFEENCFFELPQHRNRKYSLISKHVDTETNIEQLLLYLYSLLLPLLRRSVSLLCFSFVFVLLPKGYGKSRFCTDIGDTVAGLLLLLSLSLTSITQSFLPFFLLLLLLSSVKRSRCKTFSLSISIF